MIYENKMKDIEIISGHSFDFPPHVHTNMEILICTHGSFKASCNDVQKTLYSSDVMIAFPGDVHSYQKTEYGKGIIIIFNPNISDVLSTALNISEYKSFIENIEEVLPPAAMLDEYHANASSSIITYGILHSIVGIILEKAEKSEKKYEISTFNAVIKHIALHYNSTISLKSISKQFGISECHLSRMFSKKIEGGFKGYLNLLRIEKSKELLKTTDKSIYEIMLDSGFCDQGTFNRVFRQRVKMTPKEYRRTIKKAKV